MLNISREELAWAAGLFEGEGSIIPVGKAVSLSLTMCDEEVVKRFNAIFGVGQIRPRKKLAKHYKTPWEWRCGRFEHSQAVLAMMWPWLGSRRKARAKELLLIARSGRNSPGTGQDTRIIHCPKGHPYNEQNTYVDKFNARICRTCRRESVKRWHKRKQR